MRVNVEALLSLVESKFGLDREAFVIRSEGQFEDDSELEPNQISLKEVIDYVLGTVVQEAKSKKSLDALKTKYNKATRMLEGVMRYTAAEYYNERCDESTGEIYFEREYPVENEDVVICIPVSEPIVEPPWKRASKKQTLKYIREKLLERYNNPLWELLRDALDLKAGKTNLDNLDFISDKTISAAINPLRIEFKQGRNTYD